MSTGHVAVQAHRYYDLTMKAFANKVDGALNHHGQKYFAATQIFIAVTTLVSILAIILETVPSLSVYHSIFVTIEWVAVIIFTVEFLARLAVSKKKLKYVFSFWGLVDIISILPTFLGALNLTFLKSFRELRIIRMLRTLRLAKVARAYTMSKDKTESVAEHNKINVVIYFGTLISMTIILASALYAFEHAQSAYSTIPLAMIQSSKIIIGGLGQAQTATLAGEITVIIGRFIGLALFGLLIAVVGGILNQVLFGKTDSK